MKPIQFTKGLHKLTKSVYAYLLPDGSWGLNNAGLVFNEGEALIIDTLYDLKLTASFRAELEKITGMDAKMKYLVNTHANGDHFFGNVLFKGTEIIASRACVAEMQEMLPAKMALFARIHWLLGAAGKYFHKHFRKFTFSGITPLLPSLSFSRKMELKIGKLTVQCIEVGPAHTMGDIIVFIPEEKVLFAADILFVNAAPIIWAGPVSNCIKACDLILNLDAEIIVPGHGPVTNKDGVKKVKAYYEYIYTETCKRFERKMNVLEAAIDIDLKEYSQWNESERLAANVAVIYRELDPRIKPQSPVQIFNLIYRYQKAKGKKTSAR